MATCQPAPVDPSAGDASRRRVIVRILQVLGVGAGYAVLAAAGESLSIAPADVSPAYPAAGLALAACLLFGYPVLIGVALAVLGQELARFGVPVSAAVAGAVAATAGPAAACWLLRRDADPDHLFADVPAMVRFLAIGGVVAPAVSALIGLGAVGLMAGTAGVSLVATAAIWWVGDAIGTVTLAPLLLCLASRRHRRLIAAHAGEFTLMLVAGAAAVLASFGLDRWVGLPNVHAEALVFPVLIWAALRFAVPGAASASAVVAACLFAGTLTGVGPHAGAAFADVLSLQILVGVLVTAALILGAAIQAEAEAKRSKTRFLANISHELRTPLNAIIGFAELIRDRVNGDDPATYSTYAGHIRDSGKHLLELVNDVLDVARIEQAAYGLTPEWLDPAAVVHATTAMVRQDADARGVQLGSQLGDDLPPVYADERAVRQILLNLLTNAVKFTDAGGRVDVSARADGEGLVVAVADTGRGMNPAEIPRLMKPFERTQQRRAGDPAGTGLGLAISDSLARQHGGALEVSSAPGEGTTARLYLPANGGSPEA